MPNCLLSNAMPIRNNAMMGRSKYEVPDPAYYDPLIREHKKRVRRHPKDAGQWLEHGCLHEAKIEMIRSLAKRTFSIRYFIPMYLLLVSAVVIFGNYIFSIPHLFISTKHFTFYSVSMHILLRSLVILHVLILLNVMRRGLMIILKNRSVWI